MTIDNAKRLEEICEFTLLEGDDLDFLKHQITAAKAELDQVQNDYDHRAWPKTVRRLEAELDAANAEIERLNGAVDSQIKCITGEQAQLTYTNKEIDVLTFKVSNLTTEKEVANAEIDRLKEANEHWHTIVSFHKTDMDAVTGKLTAERGNVKKLSNIFSKIDHEVKDNILPCNDDVLLMECHPTYEQYKGLVFEANRVCDAVANIIDIALADTEASDKEGGR